MCSSGNTVEWRPLYCNVLASGTSCIVVFVSDTFLHGIEVTLTLSIIQLVMEPMSYILYTEYLSLSVSVRSGDLSSFITAPMFLDISSYTVSELLEKWTFCGSHLYSNKQVTCGNICSYLFVGFLLMNPSIVPSEDSKNINSWSSVAMKVGASEKGLFWTVIPYAHSFLGFTRVWSMVSPI